MFRTYVASVLSGCCIRFHTYVANVSSKCYTRVSLAFQTYVASVSTISEVCCKCFQLFRTYVANVFSRCCKSGFGVVDVVVDRICSSRLHARGCGGARVADMENRAGAYRDRSGRGTRSNDGTRSGVGPHVKQACGAGVRTVASVRMSVR
jgi:hypothetical protein